MRDNKDVTREVERRAAGLRAQNARRSSVLYAIAAVASCVILIVALAFAMPGIVPESFPEASGLYSATLLVDSSAGGYVLIGVVGFVLGVVVTLFCVQYGKKKRKRHE